MSRPREPTRRALPYADRSRRFTYVPDPLPLRYASRRLLEEVYSPIALAGRTALRLAWVVMPETIHIARFYALL
jgi:hypothetical protein